MSRANCFEWARLCALVLVAGAAVAGCGSTEGEGAPSDVQSYLERYWKVRCEARAFCCELNGETHDVSACVSKSLREYALSSGVAHTLDPAAAEQCIGEIEAWEKSCPPRQLGWQEPAACARAITGTLPLGAECDHSADCAASEEGPVFCLLREGDASLKSRCAVSVAPAPGQPCDATETHFYRCELFSPEFHCNLSSRICEKNFELGGACDRDRACGRDAYCDQGICQPRPGVGDDCSVHDCDTQSWCDDTTANTCQPNKPIGEACEASLENCEEYCSPETKTCVHRAYCTASS